MGQEIYKIPESTGKELEEYFDKRQYPYVKREGENEFVVMVHSRPFGKEPLSDKEKEERKEAKEEKKEKAYKKKLDNAKRKVAEAKERLEALGGD